MPGVPKLIGSTYGAPFRASLAYQPGQGGTSVSRMAKTKMDIVFIFIHALRSVKRLAGHATAARSARAALRSARHRGAGRRRDAAMCGADRVSGLATIIMTSKNAALTTGSTMASCSIRSPACWASRACSSA